jgi:hypothetical protein
MSAPNNPARDWRSALGIMGLLTWLFMFGIVEYSHDVLMANRDATTFWSTAYEVSAGYVLGFVAAMAVWMLMQLARGPVPEILSDSVAMRVLVSMGLVGVLLSALAGLVKHNLGGLTLTYDTAFVIAAAVVAAGVIPAYRRWRG